MTTRPSPSRLRARLAAVRADGERGSLVLAMLVTLVATTVAALVLPLFLTSVDSARFDDRRARQLAAAQSGVDATLARIRSGSGTAVGVRALLPCAPLTGQVPGATALRYRASVEYFSVDPKTLQPTAVAGALLACVAGVGTRVAPAFARITAVGTDTPGTAWTGVASRSVTATYVLRSTRPNVSGGNLRVTTAATGAVVCVDATAAPTPGTPVRTASCDAAAPAQMFAYTTDLTLVLTASRTAARPAGLCLSSPGGTQAVNDPITLQPCAPGTPAQTWSFDYLTLWEGTNDGKTLDSLVMSPVGDTGSGVRLRPIAQQANMYRWDPDSRVGAGAAGATRHNLVNYGQFGRCLDLKDFQVQSAYMISWPCKQTPDANEATNWNQRWYWTDPGTAGPVSGPLYTVSGANVNPATSGGNSLVNKTFCVADPGTDGGYVTTPQCDPNTPKADQQWRVIGATGASYATSYRIENPAGTHCLAVKDAAQGDFAGVGTLISKIIVLPCSASPLQKWNAPPDASAARVIDQTER